MNIIKTHYSRIVTQDFLTKNLSTNVEGLPKFVKVSLSAKFTEDYKGGVLLLFEILTFNKPCLTLSKVNNLNLNLRKGQYVGAKQTLRKKHLFSFLERFSIELLPLSKKTIIKCTKGKYAQLQFKELFSLEDAYNIYMYLQGVTSLDVVIESSKVNINLFLSCRLPVSKK